MNRSVGWVVMVIVGVVCVIGYKAFFVDTDEVLKFNDTLVDMVGESDARFNAFTVHLDQYSDGQRVNVGSMVSVRNDLEKAIHSDRDLLGRMEVPDDELCKEFHDSCLKYVENSAQIVEKYKEVIDYISKHNPGSDADADAVDMMLAELVSNDERLFRVTAACQQRMAKKFDFKLE